MIYGSRLRQAREIAMITQAELSRETQIAQAHLSRAEGDSYDIGMDRLGLVAAYLEFPGDFFTTRPLVDFGQRPVHFRSQASMSMKLADQAVRMGELVTEAYVRLGTELEGPELSLPSAAFDSPARAASDARMALGLSPHEPVAGLPILLERFGVTVIGLPLTATRRDAFSLWSDGRAVVALLDSDAGDRQLWSTAHELGHLMMHRDTPASRDIESEADDFASEFLLPTAAIDSEMPLHPTMSDFAMLKRRWGVSVAALIRTARQLERIGPEQYTSLFRQMSARGERLRERTFIPATKPRGLRAMAELVYGVSPAAGLAEANHWTVLFAEKVLDRHARPSELPLARPRPRTRIDNVMDFAEARRARGLQN